jgi:hypothetical protein
VVIQPSIGLENLATSLAKELLSKPMLTSKMLFKGTARAVLTTTQVAAGVVRAPTRMPMILQTLSTGQNKHAHLALNTICFTQTQLSNHSTGNSQTSTSTPIFFCFGKTLLMVEGKVLAQGCVGRRLLVR